MTVMPKHDLLPEGEAGIRQVGYRDYVGGMWDVIGRLQFNFLVAHGLAPSHCLLDIGCGALRGGVHFIRYLDRGHYLGLEKSATLVDIGIERELGAQTYSQKLPEFVISDCFEFSRFSRKPDVSIAQSLFTHLNHEDIGLCLGNLRSFAKTGHQMFVTFFEGDSARNRQQSHSHAGFHYSRTEMEGFGAETGWQGTYLGEWNHPRQQLMMKYAAI